MLQHFVRDNSVTLVLLAAFAACLVGQLPTGWQTHSQELAWHGVPDIALSTHALSSSFLSSVFENWESEFLSTAVLAILTIFLRKGGSPESKPVPAPTAQMGA